MVYKCKYFDLKELFPPFIYNNTANKEVLWWLMDSRILITIDMLRDKYGPILCNNWEQGLRERGFRDPSTLTGAKYSQHKHGRAVDLSFYKTTVDAVRNDILNNPFAEEFKYITCVEIDVTWLHIDVRNWDKTNDGILKVKPS